MRFGSGGYITGDVVWGATGTRSTVSVSGAVVTITFGAPNTPANVATVAAVNTMQWRPMRNVTVPAGVTDLATNNLVGDTATGGRLSEVDSDPDF